ncbi:MAG: hypothetical protein R3276_10375 [Marinobacter sp.]|nr:hypothetical protein [Marinobacter sp.]
MTRESPAIESSGKAQVMCRDDIVRVAGWLGPESALAIRNEGERLIAAGSGALEINLSDVVGAHSATLSLLLCWSRFATHCERPLSFTHANQDLIALSVLGGVKEQLFGEG